MTFDEYEAERVRLEKSVKQWTFCEEEAVQYGRWVEAAECAVKKSKCYYELETIAMEYYGQVEEWVDESEGGYVV